MIGETTHNIELGRPEAPLKTIAQMVYTGAQVLDDGGDELHTAVMEIIKRAWNELGKWIDANDGK